MLVDVMLPYYGDVQMMQKAVASIIAQEDPNFRLTIIDDGYEDPELPQYFSNLLAQDSRIRYYRNEKNLGANANYRKCISLIDYDIAVIMGADDIMLPNYIATIRDAFKNDDVDIVHPGVKIIDENGIEFFPLEDRLKARICKKIIAKTSIAILEKEALAQSLIFGNWLYFPSIAWRSSAIKKHSFRDKYNVIQDLGLALDIICDGGKMLVTDTECFLYRRHRNSDSSLKALDGKRFREDREFFAEFAEIFAQKSWKKAKKTARIRIISRLHAITLLPKAIFAKKWGGIKQLCIHIVKF